VIKQQSWTRRQYDTAYRLCRRTAKEDKVSWLDTTPPEIMQAADYSYQAYGYEDNGWLSDERHKRFQAIKWRVASREELPF
jgi:hypothetical protein